MHDVVMLMDVEKDLKPCLKVFGKLKPGFWSYALLVMFPNCLLCINRGVHEFLVGLSHHLVKENINVKKGKTKPHAKLQCWMGRWPYKPEEYIRHVEHWHEGHMEYGGMNGGCGKPKWKTLMINTYAIHAQIKEGANFVMPKVLQPL